MTSRTSAAHAGYRPVDSTTSTPKPPEETEPVQNILDAILAGDTAQEDFANLALPESYRAVTVHKDEVDMFEGMSSKEKDPRKSLHLDEVPLPELGPGEAFVA